MSDADPQPAAAVSTEPSQAARGKPRFLIKAVFQPQGWQGDQAIDLDGAQVVDITKPVLVAALSRTGWLASFKDNSSAADALVNPFELGHSGPYRLQAEEAILEAFDVAALSDIDAPMLLAAAQGHLALDGDFGVHAGPQDEAIGALRVDLALIKQAHRPAMEALYEQVEAHRPGLEKALLRLFHEATDAIKDTYGSMAANACCDDDDEQDQAISQVEDWVVSNMTDEVDAIVLGLGYEQGSEALQELIERARHRAMSARPAG